MIVGYDIACYSYGSGPCVPPSQGFARTTDLEAEDRDRIMRELLRAELARNPIHPRTTSVIATLHWTEKGEDRSMQLRAGLLDRNLPERAPYPYQTEAMAEFVANVWVGENEPATGITGSPGG
jgi:hypothetical protein